jgi:hypothetical protein
VLRLFLITPSSLLLYLTPTLPYHFFILLISLSPLYLLSYSGAIIPPTPSLPGLAFAVCTAALPSLQLGDSCLATALLALLRTALPLMQLSNGHTVSSSSPSFPPSPSTSASAVDEVTHERIQHLLNRVEQMLTFPPHRPPCIDLCTSLASAFKYLKVDSNTKKRRGTICSSSEGAQ